MVLKSSKIVTNVPMPQEKLVSCSFSATVQISKTVEEIGMNARNQYVKALQQRYFTTTEMKSPLF